MRTKFPPIILEWRRRTRGILDSFYSILIEKEGIKGNLYWYLKCSKSPQTGQSHPSHPGTGKAKISQVLQRPSTQWLNLCLPVYTLVLQALPGSKERGADRVACKMGGACKTSREFPHLKHMSNLQTHVYCLPCIHVSVDMYTFVRRYMSDNRHV